MTTKLHFVYYNLKILTLLPLPPQVGGTSVTISWWVGAVWCTRVAGGRRSAPTCTATTHGLWASPSSGSTTPTSPTGGTYRPCTI